MNPFEMTVDPDGGGATIRVKHGYVVLTREEEERAAECMREMLAENDRLRELLAESREANERLRTELRCCKDIVRSRYANPVPQLVDRIAKLMELVDLYDYGLAHDGTPSESLGWSRRIEELRKELVIGVAE